MYDLIVVGGSAIGFFLAKEFSKKGNSVLLLEKRKKIGKKLCSGLVSSHIFEYFSKKDFSSFLEREIEGARLWIEEKVFEFKGKAYVLNREKFDNYLFERAEKERVEILLGKEVINIKEKESIVEVFLKSGKVFKSRLVAGCDGCFSTVAKKAGFFEQKKLLFGVIFYLKETPKEIDNFVDLFFSRKFSGFFIWRIPRGNSIEWGIALKKEQNPLKKLKEFLKERNLQLKNPKAAFFPYFPLKITVKKRIFLCGDAAGQIKPYTGGGLIYGFKCAKIAAKVINNFKNPNLQEYEKAWRDSLMREIHFGNFLRKCYFLPSFLKKAGLSFLKSRKKIDQDNPSSIFKF